MIEGDEPGDAYVDQLVALDEAMANGETASRPSLETEDLGEKLARSQRCLKLLRRYGKSHSSHALKASAGKLKDENINQDIDVPKQFGRFDIVRELGRGGFGVVLLAHDPSLNRNIALKVPYAGALIRPELRARFQQEARLAAGLDHSNIVQVYESGNVGPVCYVASAYCPGSDLAQWLIQRRELLNVNDAARLVATLADAIEHAHQRGVFHRDIKPANIIMQVDPTFLTNQEDRPEALPVSRFIPRITDFGLAKSPGDSSLATHSGAVLGTPCYMAPEQAGGQNKTPTASVDIYSLGAVLYQLLTGYVPFQGDSPVETIQQVLNQEPLPPTRLRKSVPRDLETICLKCLQKSPSERYPSARELYEDLNRFLKREPILARPVSNLERAWRFCRRKPLAAGLSSALVATLVIGFFTISMLWHQSEVRRAETEEALDDVQTAKVAADAENQRSQHLLYLHDIALAQGELRANREHAIQLLKNCPEKYRGWEWDYLNRLCHLELCTMDGHKLGIRDCVFAPDGNSLITVSGIWGEPVIGEVMLWDTRNGKLLDSLSGIRGSIMHADVHPSGKWVAAAEMDWSRAGLGAGGLRLWELQSKQLIELPKCTENMFDVAFSADGRYLAGAAESGNVLILDTQSFELKHTIKAHKGNTFTVSMHPKQPILASGGYDGSIALWDCETGKLLHRIKGFGDIRTCEFSPDGKYLAFTNYSGSIFIMDVAKREIASNFYGHNSRTTSLAWTPDGRSLICSLTREGVELIEVASGKVLQQFGVHYPYSCAARCSPDGTLLATAGADRVVHIWDLTQPPSPQTHPLETREIVDFACVPNSNWVVYCAAYDRSVMLFDMESQSTQKWMGHAKALTSIAASSNGQQILSGGLDKQVCLWSLADGKLLHAFQGHKHEITEVEFADEDRTIISSDRSGQLKFWDNQQRVELESIQAHGGPIRCLATSPSGKEVASGGQDGRIQIWSTTSRKLLATWQAHAGPIRHMAYSPDGQTIASAGDESTIYLWPTISSHATDGTNTILPPPPHARKIETTDRSYCSVEFSPDSRRLVTSSTFGVVRIWDTQFCHEALRLFVSDLPSVRIRFDKSGSKLLLANDKELFVFDGRKPMSNIDDRYADKQRRRKSWLENQWSKAVQRDADGYAALFYASQIEESPANRLQIALTKGDALAYEEKWAEADPYFATAYSMDTSRIQLQMNRLLLMRKRKDEDGFQKLFEEIRTKFGGSDNLLHINAIAWAAVLSPHDSPDYESLVERLNQAISVSRNSAMQYALRNTKAGLLIRMKRFAEAKTELLQACEINGSIEVVDNCMLAIISRELGDNEKAEEHLQSAKREHASSHWQRIREIWRIGRWQDRVTNELFLDQAAK